MKFFLSLALIGSAILLIVFAAARHSQYSPMDNYVNAVVKEYNDSTRHANEVADYLTPNKIIKQITDDRGLISVVYSQDGQKLALDYLNRAEYDSLVNVLKMANPLTK